MALQGIAQVDLMINKGKDNERRGADLVDLSQDSQIALPNHAEATKQAASRMRNNNSSKVSFLKKIKPAPITIEQSNKQQGVNERTHSLDAGHNVESAGL